MDDELQRTGASESESDEYSLEEESAKLQAEAQKVTRELEDILGSHRSKEPAPIYDYEEQSEEEEVQERRQEPPAPKISPPRSEVREMPAAERATTPPSVPNWRKLNTVLSQHGFPIIPVRMGDNLDLIPDSTAVCDVMLKIIAEYEKRRPSLDTENLRSTQKLVTELNLLRSEKSSLIDENGKLKYRLESDREQLHVKIKETEVQLKDLERQSKVLKNKLETAYANLKQREQTISELKTQLSETHRNSALDVKSTQDREKAVFRRFFNREPGQGTIQDSRILNLITLYEEARAKAPTPPRAQGRESPSGDLEERHKELLSQFQKLVQEKAKIEAQRKILADENLVLKAELQERPTSRQYANLQEQLAAIEGSQTHEAEGIVKHVMEVLDLRNPRQLPVAVDRMQQVIRAVPSLEAFIKAVCAEVLPGSNEEARKSLSTSMEEVVPTIRSWKHKLAYYDSLCAFRNQLCTFLRLEPSLNTPDFEIVWFTQFRAVKSLHGGSKEVDYFKSLFEVSAEEEIVKVMNQVFLFVHEMKALLQVRSTQFSRDVLGLDQSVPLAAVLDAIKDTLQR